jgi:hypothetical protein
MVLIWLPPLDGLDPVTFTTWSWPGYHLCMVLFCLTQMHSHDLVTFNAGPWSVTESMALIPSLSVHGLDFLPLLHGLI